MLKQIVVKPLQEVHKVVAKVHSLLGEPFEEASLEFPNPSLME